RSAQFRPYFTASWLPSVPHLCVSRQRRSAASERDHGVGLGIDDDVQAVAAKVRRHRVAAPQGLDEARVRGCLRLLAKRLRIGLAEKRLRRLGLAGVGPCAGAAENESQGGGSKRERAAGG